MDKTFSEQVNVVLDLYSLYKETGVDTVKIELDVEVEKLKSYYSLTIGSAFKNFIEKQKDPYYV